jgi:hypothetical protein
MLDSEVQSLILPPVHSSVDPGLGLSFNLPLSHSSRQKFPEWLVIWEEKSQLWNILLSFMPKASHQKIPPVLINYWTLTACESSLYSAYHDLCGFIILYFLLIWISESLLAQPGCLSYLVIFVWCTDWDFGQLNVPQTLAKGKFSCISNSTGLSSFWQAPWSLATYLPLYEQLFCDCFIYVHLLGKGHAFFWKTPVNLWLLISIWIPVIL